MRVIIAGGRDYQFTYNDYRLLEALSCRMDIQEVITGGATGADECGKKWAESRCLPHKEFPANWNKYGRGAGPVRNNAMVRYLVRLPGPYLLIAFPGGKGTADITKKCALNNVTIIQVPPEPVKPKPNPASRWRRKTADERKESQGD